MAESIPPDSGFARTHRPHRLLGRLASLALVLEVALALRVAASDAIEWYVRTRGRARLDLFPDTDIYWELARAIRAGGPYEYVEWGDIPHFAIRTPGYPLLLAACQAAFGERTLPVRLVQAALGTLCVYLVYRPRAAARPAGRGSRRERCGIGLRGDGGGEASPRRCWTVPLIAAAIAAVNPHYLVMSSLLLSEAAFEPLMLAALLGVAVLWPASRRVSRAGSRDGDSQRSHWVAARPPGRRCWSGRRGRCSSRRCWPPGSSRASAPARPGPRSAARSSARWDSS